MKFLIFVLLLAGCSTGPVQKLSPEKIYKRDMIITIDGKSFEGVGVIPAKVKHKFHVEARGNLDLFTLNTCHREWSKEKAWNVKKTVGHWFWKRKIDKNKREVQFEYTPNGLEQKGSCSIHLGGFEIGKGRHSWGLVDRQTSENKLRAYINCNDESYYSPGVTVCQSREGLIQSIKFEDEVMASSKCPIKQQGKYFEFPLEKGMCIFRFRRIKKPRTEHRLTTIGYESILIRN